MKKVKIGERLYNLRKEKGLSQEELAGMLNVSRQTISKWETCESNPDFDKIEPLCEIYNISADELIRGIKNENNEGIEVIKEKEENSEALNKYRKWKKYEGFTLAGCILLYFISIVWIIFVQEAKEQPLVSDGIMVCVFLLIIGIATCIITCYYVSLSNIKRELIKEVPENKEEDKYNDIDNVTALIFCVVYLLISFLTMQWAITWILWIIYAIVIKIIHIVLDEKEKKNEK